MSLEQALENNAELDVYGEKAVVDLRLLGEIFLPTGRIVACDPFMVYNSEPFEQKVKPGRYPLTLSIAHFSTDQRIVLATIHFSVEKPKTWITATTARPGSRRFTTFDNLTTVEGVYNFIVDYGCASYMDMQAASVLTERLKQDQDYIYGLAKNMHENYIDTREWAIVVLDSTTDLNVAMFSSGVGDGSYYSYWGCTDNDEIVCLTTDFGVFKEPDIKRNDSLTLWAR